MSIWSAISDAIARLSRGAGLTAVLDAFRGAPEERAAFAVAVIGLGAKMAKADGQVTRDEVSAFREVFTIAPEDEQNAARFFNLARQDVSGFESYAQQIRDMYREGGDDALTDVLEGLFHIAMADGRYHPAEDAFLQRVGEIFGLPDRCFRRIRARFVPEAERDPYEILGVEPDQPLDEIRAHWRALVRQTHPDRMIARGVPQEAIKLAEAQLIALNAAWEQISAEHPA